MAGNRRASGRRQAVLEREAGGGAAPRFAVEAGTFTGYSSLCIARGLPDGARLLCCDVSEEFTARRFSERAGVQYTFELRVAPAIDTGADGVCPDWQSDWQSSRVVSSPG